MDITSRTVLKPQRHNCDVKELCGPCGDIRVETPATKIGLDEDGQAHYLCEDCAQVFFSVLPLFDEKS